MPTYIVANAPKVSQLLVMLVDNFHPAYYVILIIVLYAANKIFALLVPRDSAQLQLIMFFNVFNVQFLVVSVALKQTFAQLVKMELASSHQAGHANCLVQISTAQIAILMFLFVKLVITIIHLSTDPVQFARLMDVEHVMQQINV